MPRIEEYRALCAVIEERSFSRAAARLGLSQPAVSQRIKALERTYGRCLLLRSRLGVAPTEEGKAVYDHALQIVGLYERSQRSVRDREQGIGSLKIGASTGLGESLLPQALAQFRQSYPSLSISLHVADSGEVLERVLLQHLEIGFVGAYRPDQHLQFEPLVEDRLIFVVAPDHPLAQQKSLSIEQLTTVPLVLQQEGSGATQALRGALDRAGLSLKDLQVDMQVGLQESTKNAVMAGLGGTVISRLGASEEIRARRLVEVPLLDVDLTHSFFVVTRRLFPMPHAGEKLVDLVRDLARRAVL
jgi:DNA-binding transcriptional LysR family regulator